MGLGALSKSSNRAVEGSTASSGSEFATTATAHALVIDVRGVSLTFQTRDGEVQALSNVDLQVGSGDFVSFIGPSGCGKTTLLRVIADLQQPSAGTILINGVTPERARLQRHYGYIFQAPALYPWRTIERNVALPLEIMGFDAVERRRRVERYLKLVNLSGFERKFPWQLSGGMQQNMRLKFKEHFPDVIAMANRDKKDRTVGRGVPEVYSMHPYSNCPHTGIDCMNLIELALAVRDVVFGELLCIPFFNGRPTGKDT